MRHHLRVIFAVFLIASVTLLIGGCDTFSGVTRTTTLRKLPTTRSIEEALHHVPELRFIQYRQVPAETAHSLYEGTINKPPYDQFYYRGCDAAGTLEIQQSDHGEKTLKLYCLWINYVPSREELDRAKTLMDKVYKSLCLYVPEVPPTSTLLQEQYCDGFRTQ